VALPHRRQGLAAGLVWLVLLAGCHSGQPGFRTPDLPYLATPEQIGVEMLRVAGVGRDDVVYDLGSGDGRLVIAAAREFGARAVGVELDPTLIQTSRERAAMAGVGERARFLWQDLFETKLNEASVVALYLREDINLRLQPKLLQELAPGSRVVSHDFRMGPWIPDRVEQVRGPERIHTIYLWTVPADVVGRWSGTLRGRGGERPAVLDLAQRFQQVVGTLHVDGTQIFINGHVEGTRVTVVAERADRLTLVASVNGEEASGELTGIDGAIFRWTARREAQPTPVPSR
jgi:SAM-dependent methyltransferase